MQLTYTKTLDVTLRPDAVVCGRVVCGGAVAVER
jgi:hypothetical protein